MKRVGTQTSARAAARIVVVLLPALSVVASLLFAVANGIMMQGIANGSLQLLVSPPGKAEPFDRPGFSLGPPITVSC